MLKKCKDFVLPLIIGLFYIAQHFYPELTKFGAVSSDHPRWWQFFLNGFMSGNLIHLVFNMCGLWVVSSQFASRLRLSFILIYFTLFSALSSYLYYLFFMPSHAWLVGASGGVYALVGFLCWFQRKELVCFFGLRVLAMPFLPAVLILLGIEFLVATFWIRVLAWSLHVIAFSISILTAIACHAAYIAIRKVHPDWNPLFVKEKKPQTQENCGTPSVPAESCN